MLRSFESERNMRPVGRCNDHNINILEIQPRIFGSLVNSNSRKICTHLLTTFWATGDDSTNL